MQTRACIEPVSGADQLVEEARAVIGRYSPADARAAADRGEAVIVDTRDSGDRAREGVVGGAVHIPLSVLPWRADPASALNPALADMSRQVIVMCNDGFSSSIGALWLYRMGRQNVADIDGGFHAWLEAGLPVERL